MLELILLLLCLFLAGYGVHRAVSGDVVWGIVIIVLAIVLGVFFL